MDAIKKTLLITFFLFANFLSCNIFQTNKEVYLIPDTFAGEFRIIYSEKCGLTPKVENGQRLLEIPHNGILIIQPELEKENSKREYYLVNRNGIRIKLNLIQDYEERRAVLPGIFYEGFNKINANLSQDSPSKSNLEIQYLKYIVFNEDAMTMDEREKFEFFQNFDSNTNALVNECRLNFNK
jgi:hypothetical protein